jgi:Zn finger protein HypA/HybF involved in hydrogenase expression
MRFRKNRITSDLDGFKKIVAESHSIREVLQKLRYKESGGIYVYLHKMFDYFNIDTSHFNGQCWNKGLDRQSDKRIDASARRKEISWKDAFAYNSSLDNDALLRRLITSGTREYKCESCGVSRWQDKPLRLQIDHKDGDRLNNREDNLAIVCPNCHSQTDTFSSGKRKRLYRRRWWQKFSDGELERSRNPIGTRYDVESVGVGGSSPPVSINP